MQKKFGGKTPNFLLNHPPSPTSPIFQWVSRNLFFKSKTFLLSIPFLKIKSETHFFSKVKSFIGGSFKCSYGNLGMLQKNIEVKSCVQIFTHFYANFASIRKVIFATQGIDMMKSVLLKLRYIYYRKQNV